MASINISRGDIKYQSQNYTSADIYIDNWNSSQNGAYMKLYVEENPYYEAAEVFAYFNINKGTIEQLNTTTTGHVSYTFNNSNTIELTYNLANHTQSTGSYNFSINIQWNQNTNIQNSYLNEFINAISSNKYAIISDVLTSNTDVNDKTYPNFKRANDVSTITYSKENEYNKGNNIYSLSYNLTETLTWFKKTDSVNYGLVYLPETTHWNKAYLGFKYNIKRGDSNLSFDSTKLQSTYTLGKVGISGVNVNIYNRYYDLSYSPNTPSDKNLTITSNNINNTSVVSVAYANSYTSWTLSDVENAYYKGGSVVLIYDKKKNQPPIALTNNRDTLGSLSYSITYNPIYYSNTKFINFYIKTGDIINNITNYTITNNSLLNSVTESSSISVNNNIVNKNANNEIKGTWIKEGQNVFEINFPETADFNTYSLYLTVNTVKYTPVISYNLSINNIVWPNGNDGNYNIGTVSANVCEAMDIYLSSITTNSINADITGETLNSNSTSLTGNLNVTMWHTAVNGIKLTAKTTKTNYSTYYNDASKDIYLKTSKGTLSYTIVGNFNFSYSYFNYKNNVPLTITASNNGGDLTYIHELLNNNQKLIYTDTSTNIITNDILTVSGSENTNNNTYTYTFDVNISWLSAGSNKSQLIQIPQTTHWNGLDIYYKLNIIKANPNYKVYVYKNDGTLQQYSSSYTITYNYGTSTIFNSSYYLGHAYDNNKLLPLFKVDITESNNYYTYINNNNYLQEYNNINGTFDNVNNKGGIVTGKAKKYGTNQITVYFPESTYYNPLRSILTLNINRATLTNYDNYWKYKTLNFTYNSYQRYVDNNYVTYYGNYNQNDYIELLSFGDGSITIDVLGVSKIGLVKKTGSNFDNLSYTLGNNNVSVRYIAPGSGTITRHIPENDYYNRIIDEATLTTNKGNILVSYIGSYTLLYPNLIYRNGDLNAENWNIYQYKNWINTYTFDNLDSKTIDVYPVYNDGINITSSSLNTNIVNTENTNIHNKYQVNWVSSNGNLNNPSNTYVVNTKSTNTYWNTYNFKVWFKTFKAYRTGITTPTINSSVTFDTQMHTVLTHNNPGTVMWYCSNSSTAITKANAASKKSQFTSTIPQVRNAGKYYVWWYIAEDDNYLEYNNTGDDLIWMPYYINNYFEVSPITLDSSYLIINRQSIDYNNTENITITFSGLPNDTDSNRGTGSFNYTLSNGTDGEQSFEEQSNSQGFNSSTRSNTLTINYKAIGKKNSKDILTVSFLSSNTNYRNIENVTFELTVIPWAVPFTATIGKWTWDGNYDKYSSVKITDTSNKWGGSIHWGLTTNYNYDINNCIYNTNYQLGNQNLASIIETPYEGTTIYFKIDGGDYYNDNTGSVKLYVNRLYLEGPTEQVSLTESDKYHIYVEEERTLYTNIHVVSKGEVKVNVNGIDNGYDQSVLKPTITRNSNNTNSDDYNKWTLKVKAIRSTFNDYVEIYSPASGNHAASNRIKLYFHSGPIENLIVQCNSTNWVENNVWNNTSYIHPDDNFTIYCYTYYDATDYTNQSQLWCYFRGTATQMTYDGKIGSSGISTGFVRYKTDLSGHRIISNSAPYQLNTIVINRALDRYRFNAYSYIYYNTYTYTSINVGNEYSKVHNIGDTRIQYVYKDNKMMFRNPNPNTNESLNHTVNGVSNVDAIGLTYYIAPEMLVPETRED